MIPVVEGLLPEPYNQKLMVLLFRLAEWHALAKLRMHTGHTLDHLSAATTAIGRELRSFRDWTREFNPVELPQEVARRQRRKYKKAAGKRKAGAADPPSLHKPSTLQNLPTT